MPSEVEICNAALIKMGDENTISAIGEDGREGETCELMYPQVRDLLLASHPWNFAIGRSTLSKNATSPAFEFDNQFLLPGDYLRGLMLYDSDEPWKVEGDQLLTNASTVKLIYIKKVTDTGIFPPLFVEALATRLAAEMAEVITGSSSRSAKLFKEFESKFREAKRRDGQEGTPDSLQANAFTKTTKSTHQFWR